MENGQLGSFESTLNIQNWDANSAIKKKLFQYYFERLYQNTFKSSTIQ